MFKAVKECLKNWLVTHERLYWYIVIGLAVLGFGIVTALGCAKLERAEAAEMSIEHEYLYASEAYSRAEQWIASNLQDGQHYVIFAVDQNTDNPITNGQYQVGCIISNSATVSFSNNNGMYNLSANYWFNVNGSTIKTSSNSYIQVGKGFNASAIYTLEGDISLVGLFPSATNVMVYEKPISVMYSTDAPYTNFQRVTVNYGYEADSLKDFYNDWMTANRWKYFGHLNNIQPEDLRYSIEPTFLLQLPTVDYVLSAFSSAGIDLTVDSELSIGDMYKFYKCLPDLVQSWYYDSKAPYVEYEFDYFYDLELDANGNFTYELSYLEMEYLLRTSDSVLAEKFSGYSSHFRAIYMTFAHIQCVTSVVETERDDVILYGKITTNRFNRGIYDTCVEVIPDIDPSTMTPEEMDEIISEATQDAHNKYVEDLQNRVEALENQMGGMTSVDGAFVNLEGSDLWTGFISLVNGLGSLGPAIASLSSLTGAVFAFLPVTITGIMSTTLFAICIIAIIKAIRG